MCTFGCVSGSARLEPNGPATGRAVTPAPGDRMPATGRAVTPAPGDRMLSEFLETISLSTDWRIRAQAHRRGKPNIVF